MEANGRLQGSNNICLWPECLVEAAAGDFRGLRVGKRKLERPNNRGPWRQTAGFKALTTNACGQSAWSKLGWQTAGLNALTTEGHGGKRQASRL